MRHAFRALAYRNYRLFFGGQTISLVGTWMQMVAMQWLVFRLTGSAILLGVVSFAGQLPAFIISPFAGVWIDAMDRRRLLIITQALAALQGILLGVLVFTGNATVPVIIAMSVWLGVVGAFDTPARQAFLPEIIEKKEDVGNAIALNSSQFNIARLVGPSVAGLVIKLVGEGVCFLINGISYIGVIVALMAMKVQPRERVPVRGNMMGSLKEGFRYAFGFTPIRAILILLGLVSFCSGFYTVLMPLFAKNIFHGDSSTLGLLFGFIGAGALAGALMLAARKSVLGLGKVMVISSGLFGISLALFGQMKEVWMAAPFLVLLGFGMMTNMACGNTLIQTLVDDEMRGRVMAFYTMAFIGTMPIGNLLGGFMADRLGAPHTASIAGVIALAGCAYFATKLPQLREAARPVYESKGLITTPQSGA